LQKISLAEELAYSKNYLELEKLRLGEKLDYEIKTDAIIDVDKTLVPPMLLQPYLENAVKHGIRHLPGEEGKIIIETFVDDGKVLCKIVDNGVGIESANKINKMTNPSHQSHGTTLQQRRADLYNVAIQTTHGNNGIGTTVTLILQNIETA
jgi:two-component system, LytTR family, sensor kinase